MKHNETTEQNNINCKESRLARGKLVGYLQVQLESWTRDYQNQIQRMVVCSNLAQGEISFKTILS